MKAIFVSSTFKDMQAERDILKSKVQPYLNSIARNFGESISFSDLRWGVDTTDMTEEEQNRRVLSVCLNEIDRARPYMIVLLGERYGYMPGPKVIGREVHRRPSFSLDDLDISVTQLEIEYGALSTKEALAHTYFYFRELSGENIPGDYSEKDETYRQHLAALKDRIRSLAGDHVRFYQAEYGANGVTGLDGFADLVSADLKAEFLPVWEELGSLNIVEKTARIQETFLEGRRAAFHSEKTNAVNGRIADMWGLYRFYKHDYLRDMLPYLKYARGIHSKGLAKIQSETRARKEVAFHTVRELVQHDIVVHGNKYPAIVLQGEKGSGRTMLMLYICDLAKKAGFRVIDVFVGSTSLLSSSRGVLLYTIYRMEEICGVPHRYLGETDSSAGNLVDTLNVDEALDYMKELTDQFSRKKSLYKKGRILIAIDGIENLREDEYKPRLAFVTEHVTDQVRVLLSADTDFPVPGTEKTSSLPAPDQKEILSLIDGALKSYGKQLGEPVIQALSAKESAKNPLYLYLAVTSLTMLDEEDFRKIRESGDGMDAINHYLVQKVGELPDGLSELSGVLIGEAAGKVSAEMMRKAAEYIAISRNGLRADDLSLILKGEGFALGQVSFAQFVNYLSDLFILREDGSYDYMHASMRKGILKGIQDPKRYHAAIASYLSGLEAEDPVRKREYLLHCLLGGLYAESLACLARAESLSDGERHAAAADFAEWAREAGSEDYHALFAPSVPDDLLLSAMEFIGNRAFSVLGPSSREIKAKDQLSEIIKQSLETRIKDQESDSFHALRLRMLVRFSEMNADFPDREKLRTAWNDLTEANRLCSVHTDPDGWIRLRILTAMRKVADCSDDNEIRDQMEQSMPAFRSAVSEAEKGSSSSERVLAKAYLALGSHLVEKGVLSGLPEAIDCLGKAATILRRLYGSGEHILDDTYDLLSAEMALGEAHAIYCTKDHDKEALEAFTEAVKLAGTVRDRYKDAQAREAYMTAYCKKSVFDFHRMDKKWDFVSFLRWEDAEYAIKSTQRAATDIANELNSSKSIYSRYRTTYLTASAEYVCQSYQVSRNTMQFAADILEQLRTNVPYYERKKTECLFGIANAYTQFAEGQEQLEEAYQSVIEACRLSQKIAESGQLEDEVLQARCFTLLSDIDRQIGTPNKLSRAVGNMDLCVKILRRNAKYHDTVDSYVELGKAMRLYGWILMARKGDGDIGKAHALFVNVKEIHTMLKERGAKGDASELSMVEVFIKQTEEH
ncbi:MAG: DUF4062 domain-containing protein [Clostridia bacterium]|nr:DUF4062 domain-containing protein [Clostridia bacterium]